MKKYTTITVLLINLISRSAIAGHDYNFLNTSVIAGTLEIEAGYSHDNTLNPSSKHSAATLNLQYDASINKAISTHVTLLQEDDTSPEFDEALITIDMANGFTLTAGKLYLAFGNHESNMISDSLPLELSEARETAVQIDHIKDSLTTSLYFFKADALKNNSNESINNIGFNIESNKNKSKLGFSYRNNITNSTLISESIATSPALVSYVPGASVYANVLFAQTSLFFEYVSALNEFDSSTLTFNFNKAQPASVNFELGLNTARSVIGIAFQASRESLSLGLPESRLLLSYNINSMKNRSLIFEFSQQKDYSVTNGGSGNATTAFTAQFVMTF